MRTRSNKRARQERIYRGLRVGFLNTNPWCCRCGALSTEVHHAAGRRGPDLLRVENFVALCHDCHVWVTENPIKAKAAGLSKSRIGLA